MNRVNCDNRKERACTWHSSYISCFTSSVGHHVAGRRVLPVPLAEPVVGHRRGAGLRTPAGGIRLQELECDGDGWEHV